MITKDQFDTEIQLIITNAIREDVGDGDHSSLACIPLETQGKAKLLIKDEGILAGVEFAKYVFAYVDPNLEVEVLIEDGTAVTFGDIAFYVSGSSLSILKAERLVLNAMQRMSAIATKTKIFVDLLEGTETKILDTRKTTPGIRALEKWAVKIGGGENHRFALYDMIMLKDNHIDFLNNDGVYRILIDNFNFEDTRKAVQLIGDKCLTESSGGINEKTIRDYAECGVNYISSGALTHSVYNLDLSLKAI